MLIAMNHWASNRAQLQKEMAIPVALDKKKGVMLMKVVRPREKNVDLIYHNLNDCIFTHLAYGNEDTARFRFMYNPGFTLIDEEYNY